MVGLYPSSKACKFLRYRKANKKSVVSPGISVALHGKIGNQLRLKKCKYLNCAIPIIDFSIVDLIAYEYSAPQPKLNKRVPTNGPKVSDNVTLLFVGNPTR